MSEPVRYIVESIAAQAHGMLDDLGIHKGDTIEVPDGFPSAPDMSDPGEPVTLLKDLHPNVAWFLGSSADEGLVTLRRVWSYEEVTS